MISQTEDTKLDSDQTAQSNEADQTATHASSDDNNSNEHVNSPLDSDNREGTLEDVKQNDEPVVNDTPSAHDEPQSELESVAEHALSTQEQDDNQHEKENIPLTDKTESSSCHNDNNNETVPSEPQLIESPVN